MTGQTCLVGRYLMFANTQALRAVRMKTAARNGCERIRGAALDRFQGNAAIPIDARDRLEKAFGIGMPRRSIDVAGGAGLDNTATVHHVRTLSVARDDPDVVGDRDRSRATIATDPRHRIQDLRLDRDVECCRGFVRDDRFEIRRERDRNHNPLSHPVPKMMRILLEPTFSVGHTKPLSKDRWRAGLGPGVARVFLDALDDLGPNAADRLQRCRRFLKDHRDLSTAKPPHIVGSKDQEVLPIKQRGTRRHPQCLAKRPIIAREDTEFPRTAFAHQGEELAWLHAIRDIEHQWRFSPIFEQRQGETFQVEQPRGSGRLCACCVLACRSTRRESKREDFL